MACSFRTMPRPYRPYRDDVALFKISAEYSRRINSRHKSRPVLLPRVNLGLKKLRLSPQHQESALQSLLTLAPLYQQSLLRLLKKLQPQHQQSLLRLLEERQPQHRQSLLRLLKRMQPKDQHSLLILLHKLQPQHQQSLWKLLERLEPQYQKSLLRLLEELGLWDLSLLRLLEGLQPQHRQSLLGLLEKLDLWHQHSLLKLLGKLQPQHRQSLLRLLERMQPKDQQSLLILLHKLQPQHQQSLLLTIEQPIETLLRILGGLKSQEHERFLKLLKEQESSKQVNLLRVLEGLKPVRVLIGLEPLEQEKLMRLLEGQESLEQSKKVLRLMGEFKPLEQGELLRLLEGQEWKQQKLLNLLEKLEQLGQLRLLEGLKRPDLSKVLRLVEQLDAVGRLKQLKRLELLPAESRMIKLKKPLKLVKILETAKPQKKLVIMRQLKMKLTQLEKLVQEVERQERHKLLLEECKYLLQQLMEWLIVYLSEDGGRGSGLTHLLLDAWWLEFWEVILLAAGDVERNPGPRQMTDEQLAKIDSRALRKDGDLFVIYDAVYDCRAKWYNLCLALQVPDDDLSAIKREHRDIATCLLRGISLWLQRVHSYGPPTWRVLVDAIANSSGGDNHVLALELADKHQDITTAASSRHTRADHKKSVEMSSAFSRMYRFIVQHLQVDVGEVRASLRFLTDPRHPDQLCVPPSVYEDVTTTKELLTLLCPRYVNPVNTFVLEEIVRECGTQKCKRRLRKYIDKYMQ